MKKYRSQASLDWFDHNHPSPTRAGEIYKSFVNVSGYKGITRGNIANAILELKNSEALVLPEGDYYGGQPHKHKKTGYIIPLDTPSRFRKFGPEIDIVKSGTTIKEIKERNLTPRKAFKEALSDTETREKLKNGSYRGIGFWSPRAKRHNIIWFDVLAEGRAYLDFFRNEFETAYQSADAYQFVPSFGQIEGVRITPLKVLPITKLGGEYHVEWLEEVANCSCADSFHMESKSKKKIDGSFRNIYKYINPEQAICRHNFAQRKLAEKESDRNQDIPEILVKWPEATGLMEPWRKIKTHVYIRERSRIRRPLKTEVGTICGNIIGILEPDYAFDLKE